MEKVVIAYCTVIPVRQEPSECSEQVTQLLFGEYCSLLESQSRWLKVYSLLDGQIGWVDHKMVVVSDGETRWDVPSSVVAVPMAIATTLDGGEEIPLTMGTRLMNYNHGIFEVLDKQYLINPSCICDTNNGTSCLSIDNLAVSLLNTPYLWGGKNMMGMDCSGFTQILYSVLGVQLKRNASEQILQGVAVSSLSDAKVGDLAFFDHADQDEKATKISHVGLLLSPTEIIHCSGCVRIDQIDDQGIRLADGVLTHHLVQVRRYM
jgi:hypothetical protein